MTDVILRQITAHSFTLRLLVVAFALSCAACGNSPEVLVVFRTEQQAQQHCPNDMVVWADPQSASYSLKENASYGGAGTGRYACRKEAESAGMHKLGP
jgi:hypothetical protein